jgi:hypothetical protein
MQAASLRMVRLREKVDSQIHSPHRLPDPVALDNPMSTSCSPLELIPDCMMVSRATERYISIAHAMEEL